MTAREAKKIHLAIADMKVQVTKNYSEQGRCDIKLQEQRNFYLRQSYAQTIQRPELPEVHGTTEITQEAP